MIISVFVLFTVIAVLVILLIVEGNNVKELRKLLDEKSAKPKLPGKVAVYATTNGSGKRFVYLANKVGVMETAQGAILRLSDADDKTVAYFAPGVWLVIEAEDSKVKEGEQP